MTLDITERKRADDALRKSEERYRNLYESIDEGFCIIEVMFDENNRSVDFVFQEVNLSFEKQTGIQDVRGRSMRDIAPHHEEHWFELYGKVAVTGESMRFEYPAVELHRWYEGYAYRIGEATEKKVAIIFNDITERKRTEKALRDSEARLAGQKEALELSVSGAPIDEVLNRIARAAQEQSDEGARVALFIVDGDSARLRFGAAAGLSEAYTRAVDGSEINSNNPLCGSAAYPGDTVIVRDVATDPIWAPYLSLAREHGIGACWSFPIRSFRGRVLGILAVYHGSPREPEPRDLESIGLLAHTAALVIEQHKTAEERQSAEEALRRSKAQLEAELTDAKHLQGISARLTCEEHVDALYEKVLDAAIAIMHSQYGSMQMLYPERGNGGELRLLAFRGFNPQAEKFWEWVRADSESTCGAALRTGKRVIAPDVEKCDFMAGTEDQATYLQTGIRAVQTTPLLSRGGKQDGGDDLHALAHPAPTFGARSALI